MRHAITVALSEYMVKMDADVQAAIQRAMTPENVALSIQSAVEKELDAAIKSEISNFYRFGGGRDIIKKAVADTLARRADEGGA